MPIIQLELSAESVDEAIEKLRLYQETIEEASERIVRRLARDGEERARELVPVDTGALAESIVASGDGRVAYVRTDSPYAAFVEFGTGVIGAASPYPGPAMAEAGYAYMGGEHHITTKDGRDGWFWPGKDGRWYFTQGQPTKPFMYDTAQLLAMAVPQVVEEELKA
ncbi:MAG: HK97 gp10 family phage protein [Clostridia bacterium]|nr:HK97 gp10 family phage protein [Clostridia bacterium]